MANLFDNSYPYTDFHELNLDWIIKKIKELGLKVDEHVALNEITFDGAWDITHAYPVWHIVTNDNYAYLALHPVPVGVDISNSDYWQVIFSLTAATPFLPSNRNVIALADSYGMVTTPGFYQIMKNDQGIDDMLIDAVSGRSFARSSNTFMDAIQLIDANINYQDDVTDIIVCGGYNDGQFLQYDGGTSAQIVQAIANFIAYCKQHFKNARVFIGFIAWTRQTAGVSAGVLINTLNAYKTGARIGGIYLNNVEYILRNIRLLDNDTPGGYHPNSDGANALAQYVFQSWFTGVCDVQYNSRIGDDYTMNSALNATVNNFAFYDWIENSTGRFISSEQALDIRNTTSPYLVASVTTDSWIEIFTNNNPLYKADRIQGVCMALIKYGTNITEEFAVEFRVLNHKFYIRAPKDMTNIQIIQLRSVNCSFNNAY